MKLALLLLLLPACAFATPVVFTVDPSQTGILHKSFTLTSPDINGVVLNGQAITLDLALANDVLARVHTVAGVLGFSLTIQTNATVAPGFTVGTVYAVDRFGNRVSEIMTTAGGMGSNGTFGVGHPFLPMLSPVTDLAGMHLEFGMPDTGYTVTGATWRFTPRSPQDAVEFGTAAQLPEIGSVWLVAFGLILLKSVNSGKGYGKACISAYKPES